MKIHTTSLKRWASRATMVAVLLAVAVIAPGLALGAAVIGGFGGMIVDAEHRFSNAQAIASAASTNIIDLGQERRIGTGEPMAVVIVVTTLLDGTTGDETYTATLQTDADEGFGSPATLVPAVSLPRNSAVGTKFVIPIPSGSLTERYLRILYAVGGTTPLGNVTAFLTPMSFIQNDAYYADAITISI